MPALRGAYTGYEKNKKETVLGSACRLWTDGAGCLGC